jgi:hypothetical protein
MTATETPTTTGRDRLRTHARAFVELFALSGFAIAYPLLDLYGRAPEQFVFRGAGTRQIVGFAVVVTFVVPLVLWAVETLPSLVWPRLRTPIHAVLVAVLVAAFAVQALRPLVSGVALLVLGVALGAGAAALVLRSRALKMWLSFAALAPLVFFGLFLTTSKTSALLSSDTVAATGTTVTEPAPVVLVVFDEFPLASLLGGDGAIDGDLYPHFRALADGSHWFRNATTVSPSTWHAVPAIASGRYPSDVGAPLAANYPDTVFTLLGGDYDLRVTESITRLCPTNLCAPGDLVAEGGLRSLLDDAVGIMQARLSPSGSWTDPAAVLVDQPGEDETAGAGPQEAQDGWGDFGLNQPTRVRTFLDGIDADPRTLHYLHLLLPHVPYRYLPNGMQYPAPDLDREEDVWTDEAWPVDLARQRHLLQVAYVDTIIGELVATLREQGVYDEALVIITADHGIGFEPGTNARGLDGAEPSDDLLAELAYVPLFVKVPGQQAGETSDANVATVDVLPTIVDVLGIDVPWDLDGRSVFAEPRPDDTKPFFISLVHSYGVSAGDRVELDGADLSRRLRRLAAGRWVGPPGDDLRLWRLGPAPELVGTRVDDVDSIGLTPVEAVLDHAGDYAAVDPTSGEVPAVIKATVAGLEPGTPVAVAVNGVIVATAPTFDGDRVAVVAADRWFRPGANEVTVLRIGDRS